MITLCMDCARCSLSHTARHGTANSLLAPFEGECPLCRFSPDLDVFAWLGWTRARYHGDQKRLASLPLPFCLTARVRERAFADQTSNIELRDGCRESPVSKTRGAFPFRACLPLLYLVCHHILRRITCMRTH